MSVIDYPLHAGAVVDLAVRYRSGTVADEPLLDIYTPLFEADY